MANVITEVVPKEVFKSLGNLIRALQMCELAEKELKQGIAGWPGLEINFRSDKTPHQS